MLLICNIKLFLMSNSIKNVSKVKWTIDIKCVSEMEKQIFLFFIFHVIDLKNELWDSLRLHIQYTSGICPSKSELWLMLSLSRHSFMTSMLHHISVMMSSFIIMLHESLWSCHPVQCSTFIFSQDLMSWYEVWKVLKTNFITSSTWTFHQHSMFLK